MVGAVHQLADALEYRGQREQLSIRDTAIFEVFKHGLRSMEISKLDIGNYSGQSLQIIGAKWGSDGVVPLSQNARQALDSYLGWCLSKGFDMADDQPLFRSLSTNNYGKRLGYWGIYNKEDMGGTSFWLPAYRTKLYSRNRWPRNARVLRKASCHIRVGRPRKST